MKFQECYQIVEELIKKFDGGKKQSKLVYYYIRALCSKKLRNYEQAKSDYGILIKNCSTSNYKLMSNFMFSVVFAKSRRLDVKFDCLSYLNFK
jgi:site-specific DNA-adenine methylase